MTDHVTDFISHAVNEKPVAAYQAFDASIQDRVNTKVDELQAEVRAKIMGTDREQQEEETDIGEDYSKWKVELPSYNKTITVNKARGTAEAIKKAVEQAGGKGKDWLHADVGKVTKV